MAPIVALLICAGFIAVVLRQDLKECRGTSTALWIPFIWVAVCASRPVTYWISPGSMTALAKEFSYVLGNPTERNFLIALMSAGLIILIQRRKRFAFRFKDNIWLFLFYLTALMSVSWADYQSVSIKRWIRGIGDVIMVLVILTEDDEKEAIEHILRRCAIFLIPLSIVFVKYLRVYGILFAHTGSPMWVGVSTHKNNLALLCAFSGVLLIWRFLKSRPKINWADVILFILVLYLLRGSQSATSLVVMIIAVSVFIIEAMAKGNAKKLNTWLISSFVFVVALQQVFMTLLNQSVTSIFFSATGRNATFTDRLPLWQDLLRIGSRKPILGAGFGSFWLGSLTYDLWAKHPWRPTNGHNGYLDVFMDLGLVGVILLGFWIFQTYSKSRDGVEDHWGIGRLQLAYLIMILFHNVTESSLAMPTNYLWILFLLTSVVVVKRTVAPAQQSPPSPAAPSF